MPDVHEHVVYDKLGKPINVGDLVSTKYRGGMHAGTVCDIAYNEQQAEEKGVQHPPKVIYVDQHGHRVAHNPGTLVHGDDPWHADAT